MKISELLAIVVVGTLTIMQYGLPAPIIPAEMKRRHISQTLIGVAFASFSFGLMIGSVVPTDRLYFQYGRRRATQCGILLLSLALLLYALCYFIPDEYSLLFLIASIFSRIMEGFSVGITFSALLSLLSLIYPNERGRAITARACGAYFGMCIGAVFGGSLDMLLGYFCVYFSFSVISLFTALIIYVFK